MWAEDALISAQLFPNAHSTAVSSLAETALFAVNQKNGTTCSTNVRQTAEKTKTKTMIMMPVNADPDMLELTPTISASINAPARTRSGVLQDAFAEMAAVDTTDHALIAPPTQDLLVANASAIETISGTQRNTAVIF